MFISHHVLRSVFRFWIKHAIITGDITQIDLPPSDKSGLIDAINVLKNVNGISFVEFDSGDVVRHELVKKIISAYAKKEKIKEKKNV